MITDRFATVVELEQIIDICKRLTWLEAKVEENREVSTNILVDDEGLGKAFTLWDSNGEVLGHVGHTDNGWGFYFDDGQEPEPTNTEEPKPAWDMVPVGEFCPVCKEKSWGAHIPYQSLNCRRP